MVAEARPGAASVPELFDPVQVRGLFDRMSRSYERMNIIMSFGFSVRWRRQMLRRLPLQRDGVRVLDAMSGMGETWTELLRRLPTAAATALDFSERMADHARKRSAERFDRRIDVRCEDVLDSGLPDASFDVIISAYGMKTFDAAQTRRFVDELARVLKPGGHFSFIEVTEPKSRFLRALYMFYLGRVVPLIGVLLVSDPIEYRMLHRYLLAYGDGDRTSAALSSHPLIDVDVRRHFFGCATSFAGSRLREPDAL